MPLVRPRLTDYHGVFRPQAELDFAIPFFDEDLPLYVDPFLLWKSPSQQDQALHLSVCNIFNHIIHLIKKAEIGKAKEVLILGSECAEVGLGQSGKRKGKRISDGIADDLVSVFTNIPRYAQTGVEHFEEVQLLVQGIHKDRISDYACSFLKSFLVDFTIDQCEKHGIPILDTTVKIFDLNKHTFVDEVVKLPINPENNTPIMLVPKRWLRFNPWINYDDYFKDYCPRDKVFRKGEIEDRGKVLNYNRQNYGVIESYVKLKEQRKEECKNDPLFQQIPILSAKQHFQEIKKLPTGTTDKADRKYEDKMASLLSSMLYPHLDFADIQSRTESGVLIRDLVFYNNRSTDFLEEILGEYNSRQIVMELKNVLKIDREHINQLNRYLAEHLGRFGVIVTRNPFPQAMRRNAISLWSAHRKCIIELSDQDIELMVEVYESKQRQPVEVLKRRYVEFVRQLPS